MCCCKMIGSEKNKSATGGFSIPLNNRKRNRSPFHKDAEVAQAANARGPISNKEEVADSFQACSVCIMEYFHPPDVLI